MSIDWNKYNQELVRRGEILIDPSARKTQQKRKTIHLSHSAYKDAPVHQVHPSLLEKSLNEQLQHLHSISLKSLKIKSPK